MEKYEYEDDTVPHPIAVHQRQLALEKARDSIDRAEVESLCDIINERYRDIEAGQAYPVNTFR